MSDPQVIPTGNIVAMLRSAGSPPQGWLLCDGKPCPEKYLDNLKEYLADKETLPNLQGYTLVGAGKYTETYPDVTKYTTEYTAGSTYGVVNRTLTVEQMPSHQHFGFGENIAEDLGFSHTAEEKGYRGSNCSTDMDNPLWGSTWAGGTTKTAGGTDVLIRTYNDSKPTSAKTVNNPISAMQPSFAINYFIYGGHPKEQSR
jgi:microcystin-dependent protein